LIVGVGLGPGVWLGVSVGVGLGPGVWLGVGVGLGPGVWLGVSVGLGPGVWVHVGVLVGLSVLVGVGVLVGLGVDNAVGVAVAWEEESSDFSISGRKRRLSPAAGCWVTAGSANAPTATNKTAMTEVRQRIDLLS
jgi:hypothetical protein